MTVNRTISAFIKSPLSLLFLAGFVITLVGMAVRAYSVSPLKDQCDFPVSFFHIRSDSDVTMTRGMYRTYRDGFNKGHMTFIGNISHFNQQGLVAKPTPVNRELRFTGEVHDNQFEMTVVSQSRRLSDHSSDQDIKDYVFPHIDPGSVSTSSLYLLNGKMLAAGTETVPRSGCIN
ncbi:hypothetical protein [Pantoea sp. SOD02]|uniref:hypothetical protein n=1 Tax=Pantoea sp. SOD02 TaxID=2970818 RepID=UPI00215840F6|nr:hypothetical protein [Pantoea sp. SOD02]UVC29952.1 hypothetical protein NR302_02950 [Pantoea sp. SOD02]